MAQKIVFYDGDCGFCNGTIQFILNHEKEPAFHFAALQSEFAQNFFDAHGLPQPDMSTFYFWDGERMWDKSSGALRVSGYLKFPFPLFKVGYVLPKFIRNAMYDFVAKRRHKIAAGFCALPTPEQRRRFLEL